jgi:hypothetical protein
MFNYNYKKYWFPKKMNEILHEKMRQNYYKNNSRNNNLNRLETYSNTLDIKDNNRYN